MEYKCSNIWSIKIINNSKSPLLSLSVANPIDYSISIQLLTLIVLDAPTSNSNYTSRTKLISVFPLRSSLTLYIYFFRILSKLLFHTKRGLTCCLELSRVRANIVCTARSQSYPAPDPICTCGSP